ncbi:MAG: FAD-dependent oxidoreductase, partial [Planctomycetota bacterium]|nr:FAD-dependent oxidoreductase [Planctomycetota bacterium]
MEVAPKHAVAVIGAATAGAEVASLLAARGILVAVFERNARPFGKIEDGLPRWHEKLRNREYLSITEKLDHPLIEYVPSTAVGQDVDFTELVEAWGFAAVVLANGAWRDRPLTLGSGSDPAPLVGRGLEYQNPFVIGFNHEHDECFEGRRPEVVDGAAVIGGGLAALDVAKILNLTMATRAFHARGIEITLEHLEHEGIDACLERNELEWSDLGLRGATIYYRRRVADMPVAAIPEGADAARRAKVEATREKLVAKVRAKYLVEVAPLSAPEELIVEDGRLAGLLLRRTVIADGRLIETAETYAARHPLVVSSIGSIPEAIGGIPMKGELYAFADWHRGTFAGLDKVFAVGNVLTGKGNIAVSRRHAREVTEEAIEAYLGLREANDNDANPAQGPQGIADAAAELSSRVAKHTTLQPPLTEATLASLRARIAARQTAVGYQGDLATWIETVGLPC